MSGRRHPLIFSKYGLSGMIRFSPGLLFCFTHTLKKKTNKQTKHKNNNKTKNKTKQKQTNKEQKTKNKQTNMQAQMS